MYYLFAGANYYPGGGASDFKGEFSTLEEAKAAARGYMTGQNWWHVANKNMEIIEEG